jgi:hypothetical protein
VTVYEPAATRAENLPTESVLTSTTAPPLRWIEIVPTRGRAAPGAGPPTASRVPVNVADAAGGDGEAAPEQPAMKIAAPAAINHRAIRPFAASVPTLVVYHSATAHPQAAAVNTASGHQGGAVKRNWWLFDGAVL